MIHFIDIETGKASKRAGYYLTHAFKSECSDAEALLNYIKEEETDNTKIFKQVFNWHKVNEGTHLVKITFNIGWMYYKGFGTDQDYTKARYFIGLSADRHYTDAQ
jgi:TPR repeat protein